ncbi:hypothetical protein RF11_13042 [Thelohanellus kitauei]|uniref:Uncharacterized protein n=1 Tax=Thelohanellus kitauei TaxID=669202 RepID=A0A0C2MXC4_THEKT|nr:hypothetical protein RF11_13042 [Thelohanellus kitauei]
MSLIKKATNVDDLLVLFMIELTDFIHKLPEESFISYLKSRMPNFVTTLIIYEAFQFTQFCESLPNFCNRMGIYAALFPDNLVNDITEWQKTESVAYDKYLVES